MNGQVGLVTPDGLLIKGNDGKQVCVSLLSVEGKFVKAGKYGQASEGGNIYRALPIPKYLLNSFLKLSKVYYVDGSEAISIGFSYDRALLYAIFHKIVG